jgi:RNA polymerase sigma-70 factor (ECF subfamily)
VELPTVDNFDSFLDENFDAIRRSLALVIGDVDRAEDLAQEAFARALGRWSAVSAMERPVAWVYVVALNKARRDLRRDRYRPVHQVPPVVEDIAGTVATSVALAAALATLAPRQRAVVVLRHLAGLSIGETAQALQCAEGTVKSTLHSALSRLRVEMEEEL